MFRAKLLAVFKYRSANNILLYSNYYIFYADMAIYNTFCLWELLITVLLSLFLSLTKLSFKQPFLIGMVKNSPLKLILKKIRFSSNPQSVCCFATFRYFLSISKIVWLKIFLFKVMQKWIMETCFLSHSLAILFYETIISRRLFPRQCFLQVVIIIWL